MMRRNLLMFNDSITEATEAISTAEEHATRLMRYLPARVDPSPGAQSAKAQNTSKVDGLAVDQVTSTSPTVRLGDTPGKWPTKRNRIMQWGEDGELWLMRNLVEWGYSTCENMRERGQMNKKLVSQLQEHFGVVADAQSIKNKLRDLEVAFNTCEKARKGISGLGWVDSQVAWDPQVWDEFKQAHPAKAADLEGHKRVFTSEKYKLMHMLWGAKGRATGEGHKPSLLTISPFPASLSPFPASLTSCEICIFACRKSFPCSRR